MHEIMMKREGYSVKTSNQMIRAMTLLIRSFENANSLELKTMFMKISDSTLGLIQRFPGNSTIRDSTLQFFNRMIITIGLDILPYMNKLLAIISGNLDISAFIHILHMTHLALQTLKSSAFAFISEMFPSLLAWAINIGLPTSAVSDIEKTHVDAIKTFLKLIKLISGSNVGFLYVLPLDQFQALLDFLVSVARSFIDDLRKTGISVTAAFIAVSVGLNISAEKLTAPTTAAAKANKPVAFEPQYSAHSTILLQKSLECAFAPFVSMNSRNLTDVQCLQDIAMLHFILYKTAPEQFLTKLSSWEMAQSHLEVVKRGLEVMLNTGTVKEYKEILKQILIKSEANNG